jgi:hypothetical protein
MINHSVIKLEARDVTESEIASDERLVKMMDVQTQILHELKLMRAELAELRASKAAQEEESRMRREPPDEEVGLDYVARAFNCSLESVRRGYFGTKHIPRTNAHPIRFSKRAVDEHLARLRNKPTIEQRAAAFVAAAPKKRKRSIIKKW